MVGNPINQTNGNKYQVEDLTIGNTPTGISFNRYYNSQATTAGALGANWQHSFSSAVKLSNGTVSQFPPNTTLSNNYVTPQDACQSGWNDVRANATGSWVSVAVATYTTDGRCQITSNGAIVMTLPVYSGNSIYSPALIPLITITRPDGKQIAFRKINGAWSNESGVTEKLAEITDINSIVTGYNYTTTEDTTERYDANGKLQSISDVRGNTQTLGYDAQGWLSTVTTNTAESLTFAYDASNRISTMTDQTSRVWLFGYDTNNNLTSVTYPDATPTDNTDNPARVYLYENTSFPHALTSITDCAHVASCSTAAANHYANYEYDSTGRATASYHGPQTSVLTDRIEGVSIVYNTDGTRTVTNSRNKVSTYTTTTQLGVALVTGISGPGCSSCGSSNATSIYDGSNNLISKTDNNHVTRYGNYDVNGNPGCMVEGVTTADTSTGVCAFDPVASPNARRLDYTYDPRFHSKVATLSESSIYTGYSKLTTNTYDAYGNLTGVTITGYAPDGSAVTRTATATYAGPLHQLSQIDGPRTDVQDLTTFDYYLDDPSQGSNRARLKRVTGPTGIIQRDAIQYSATGKILSELRPNGLTLSYTYYAGNDRLNTLTETAGSVINTTRWTYLPTGEVETLTRGYGTADAVVLTFGYDAERRLTRVTDSAGNYIKYTLDTEGNATNVSTYDIASALKTTLTQTFDDYNRLDTTSKAAGNVNDDFSPDGTLAQQTSGAGAVTGYDYDALKRLTTVTQDKGGSNTLTQNTVSRYQYNAHDQVKQVTDANGNITTYGYDDLGNLRSTQSPDTGLTAYTYDAAGNLKTSTDARGMVITNSYDAANRLTQATYSDASTATTYSYDGAINGVGRLWKITDRSGVTEYTSYDAWGRVTLKKQTVSTKLRNVGYSYDSQGRLKTLTYPSGLVESYSYNSQGRINTVTANGATLLTNAGYQPFGPVNAWTFGNGQAISRQYDTDGQLWNHTFGSGSRTLLYDAAARIYNITDPYHAMTNSYDALDHLTGVTGSTYTRGYGYDHNGNRTTSKVGSVTTSYTTAAGSNQLAAYGTLSYSYDAAGNITGDGVHTYVYDVRGRMSSVDAGAATYLVNALGQRVKKVKGTATTYFVYDEQGKLLGEYNGSNALTQETLYLEDMPVGVWKGSLYYVQADHLNTPRIITDSTGTVIWQWKSEPFGNQGATQDPDGNGVSFPYNLRYPGQYFDAESGINYNYFRDYDPKTGRYVESDPIGLRGGINTYTYVGGNPVRYYDLFGLVITGEWGKTTSDANGRIDKIDLFDFKARPITLSVSIAEIFVTATGTATGCIKCKETDDCTGRIKREWETSASLSVTGSTSFHASVTPLPWWGSAGIMLMVNAYEMSEYLSYVDAQKINAAAKLIATINPTKICRGGR